MWLANSFWLAALVFWNLPETGSSIATFDEAVFRLLNNSLFFSETWAWFWAFAASDYFDIIQYVAIFSITGYGLYLRKPKTQRRQEFGILLFYYLCLTIFLIVHKQIALKIFEFKRNSPTVFFKDAYRLSLLAPNWPMKDISNLSFPGDHAAFVSCWMCYILKRYPRNIRIAAVVTTVMMSLPRLVAGAHWFTDVFIGGVLPAFALASWVFDTPLIPYLLSLKARSKKS